MSRRRRSTQVAAAERAQREADEQLRKLRNATDAALAQAQKKVEDQNKRLDDFRAERGARTHDSVIKKCVEDERRLADQIEETNRSLGLLEGNEDDERELGVLERARGVPSCGVVSFLLKRCSAQARRDASIRSLLGGLRAGRRGSAGGRRGLRAGRGERRRRAGTAGRGPRPGVRR